MISIKNLTSAAQAKSYYEEGDYYREDGRQPSSRWWGEGAKRLGLRGAFDQRVFADALAGKLPDGTELPGGHGGTRRPGVDLTFNPPKSVSLQLLVGGDERLRIAHDRAVERSLEYLEASFAQARTTVDGATKSESTANLVVARIQHEVSRELDPHLHTHCVVLNATQRSDGSWRALDNAGLYHARMSADAIYRTELAASVRALGYEVRRTRSDGQFEIAGIDDEQLAAFSKRRQQIEEVLEQRGEVGARAAERANLATRQSKQRRHPAELRKQWHEAAREVGLQCPTPSHQDSIERDASAARRAVEHAIEHLTERSTVISQRDLVLHALQLGVGRLDGSRSIFDARCGA